MEAERVARDVLNRTLGQGAEAFELLVVQEPGGLDAFEVEARGGTVYVRGTSAIALCRGAYHYLRQEGYGQSSWSGDPLRLPSELRDCAPVRVEAAAAHRHYLSVCTYGYSAVWWDWGRWEQELDWMALHGINMPLLLTGAEAVSRKVFRALGLDEESIAGYFSGPAYLCWHRLGNLTGHMGPLPDSWIATQQELQRKILDRARELGMRPIVPGFSGFVPSTLRGALPRVELRSAEPWAGFEQTTYLDPRSAEFRQVAKLYLDEYRSTYGPAHHFLCELFAEQVPCLDPVTEMDDLREIGRATWGCLVDADPEANWVMQGWPFYFARDYWTPSKSAALLEAVPAGRAFVLDLATESLETWRLHPAMREKGWMFNVVHNYGQNTVLRGDLQGFMNRGQAALCDPDRGRLQGMGISPEGIDQNPVVYELLTDLMWTAKKARFGELNSPLRGGSPVEEEILLSLRLNQDDIGEWIRDYARARYGWLGAEDAWELLLAAIYGVEPSPHFRYSWCYRPGDQPLVASRDPGVLRQALEALIEPKEALRDSSSYHRDLVDVAKTWLGAVADRYLEAAIETGESVPRERFFDALHDLDLLLATRPEHRLTTWVDSARSMGSYASEADLYERNARSLITWWGGPFLFDYAAREWSGLIADFHAERWRLWFAWRDGGGPYPDFDAWEREWSGSVTLETTRFSEAELAATTGLSVEEEVLQSPRLHPKKTQFVGFVREPGTARGVEPPEKSAVKPAHSQGGCGLAVFFPMRGRPTDSEAVDDTIGLVEELLAKWSFVVFATDPVCRVIRLEPQPRSGGAVLVDLGREVPLAAAACLPAFGQGMKARYRAEVSLDGVHWTAVSAYGGAPETCRGSRVRLLGRAVRYLRFTVDVVLGSPEQLFQIVLFEA